MPNKHTLKYVKNTIEKEGYKLLSNEYEGQLQKLDIECNKGHVFPMSFKVFKEGHRCSYCAGKRQYNIEEVRGFFEEKGYKLLSTKYNGNKEKLKVLGPNNKEYETTLFSFKVNGIIPHLKNKIYKNEEYCREIFEDITGKKFPKEKPDWLVNDKTGKKLELDGYCKELKLAFEYDGKQHFQNTDFFKEDFFTINNRDEIKNDICKKNGIKLIRIPFYIKDKKSYIENKIKFNKYLYVGDPHLQINNLKDCEKLIDFIVKIAKENNVSTIVFLGDLFHTHGVIRIEVFDFWKKTFKRIQKQYDVIALVGNHDMILGQSKNAGLNSVSLLDEQYKYNINIIDVPTEIDNIGYMPYYEDCKSFLEDCKYLYEQGVTGCLIAHQTFTGAQYENGFFSEEGIDPALVPQQEIISGHIHKSQQVGKCFYPGTPKWDTMADANQPKGIWVFEHEDTGAVKSKKFFSTENIVTPITSYEVKEGEELPALNPDARNYVVLEGKTAWINKVKKELKGKANVKVKPTDVRVAKDIKDTSITLEKYLETEFQPIEGVKKESIKEFLREV
jgi:DNA repair exonuclease SbcCD nuclease subunit